MGALEDKIAKAEDKLKQLKAEQQKIDARKKAAEVQRKRQDDTRRKVLVGAVILARLDAGEWPQAEFTAMRDAAISRAEDRRLFGLAVPDDAGQDQPAQAGNSDSTSTDY
jgi:phage shock protein A